MTAHEEKLASAWWGLKIGLGAVAFLAGLDKFLNRLTTWGMYLSPVVERLLPLRAEKFLAFVGVVEMIVGLMILTRWTRIGSYVAMGWLIAIALNLLSTGMFFDLAARDVVMALAAYALARMTEVRELGSLRSKRSPEAKEEWG